MTAAASPAGSAEPTINRAMATSSIMLATTMTTLDTTIANVALPHMAGSVSASADQITWVLTSYVIASAIVTPMSAWFGARFGRRNVFLFSILGFTITSALCGGAQTLGQIVVFRILQGALGAAMIPLSQAAMIDMYPLEKRGQAMSIWSIASMVAPIVGPVLGGWLTDNFTWRWVFYINLPVGVAAFLGVMTFLPKDASNKIGFDVTGFSFLALAVGATQLLLDRGQGRGWFDSTEIVIEAFIAVVAFLLFIIHSATFEKPFIPLGLFKDRNFVGGGVICFVISSITFSVLALLPALLQNLMGYPVMVAGLVTAPRGMGMMLSMFVAGQVANRVDARLMILVGLALLSIGFFQMSGFSLQMGYQLTLVSGLITGIGSGLVFLPMSLIAFSTVPAQLRADGAGAFALIRNVGQSMGLSIMQALLVQKTVAVNTHLSEQLRPDNPAFQASGYSFSSMTSIAALSGELGRQAAMTAYVNLFHFMGVIGLLSAPLLLAVRNPARSQVVETVMID